MTLSAEQRYYLRRRAHVHSDDCYGMYEPCGEHHAHDDQCGGRPLRCGLKEDRDLTALLDYVAELESASVPLETLRSYGWSVAVHNDYRLHGERFTFWLFTRGTRCVKGEGRSDAEALKAALADAMIE